MNWALGFTMGLMLGTTVFTSINAALRRRQLATLEALLERGTYRVLEADGSNVAARELLEALSASPAARLSRGQLARMAAAGVAAAVLAALAVSMAAK